MRSLTFRASCNAMHFGTMICLACVPASATHISAEGSQWTLRGDVSPALLQSDVAFERNGQWVRSGDYPSQRKTEEPFQDELGSGVRSSILYSGRAKEPDLLLVIKNYQDRDWSTIAVRLINETGAAVSVSSIRVLDTKDVERATGGTATTRVLSDSYSEDTPVVRIREFANMPYGFHLAVGSQLLYNRSSGQSFFAGVLTSRKWLTVFHLTATKYTVDDTGTTELTTVKSLDPKRPQDRILLHLEIPDGGELASEELAISTQADYLKTLREYGDSIRILGHARVQGAAPWGWWSWTAYYNKLSAGFATTNAEWLSAHLRDAGYNYIHLDEGYNFARGEYTTTNPERFPRGMEPLSYRIAGLGLHLGVWTAPFEVAEASWVYKNHQDWLVKNDEGQPIKIGRDLYALDPTNPGAQVYLRETYSTIAHTWRARYIKMDFMETSAVEGHYFRPNTSALEALRMGLEIIREAVGDEVILDKDGSPMLTPVGIVDAGRISNDTEHSFEGTFDAATGIAARFYMNRNYFIADPDAFCVSNYRSRDPHWGELKPVTFEEAKAAIALSAMAGGMFEDGDDLPALGTEAERIALLTNPELVKLVRLQRSAIPLDLMSYASEDLQPSLFWIRESQRQGVLAVFNWSDTTKPHSVPLQRLGISGAWKAEEIFSASGVREEAALLHIEQPGHSVRLIRLVNTEVPAIAPKISISSGEDAQAAQPLSLDAVGSSEKNPLLRYQWDFGDGISAEGAQTQHTFTHPGSYFVTVTAETVDGPTAQAKGRVVVDERLTAHFTADLSN